MAELEVRLADRLQSEHDLADVTVEIGVDAKARIAAAPPLGSTSKRVPAGKRAVSLSALVPSGMARGESVRLVTPETTATGTLIAATSGEKSTADAATVATDGGESSATSTTSDDRVRPTDRSPRDRDPRS